MAKERSPEPSRSRSPARKRRLPLAAIIVPVVAILGIAGAILLTKGGKGLIHIGPDDTIPPFHFRVGKAIGVSTNEQTSAKNLRSAAETAGKDVVDVIDGFYTEAFLDPSNWRDGSYDSAFHDFEDAATSSAEGQLDAVTLGKTAGDRFASVSPDTSKLSFRVLFDPNGKAKTVVAIADFQALAKGKDGTYTEIVSKGEFFLHDTGDGWKVFSFSVHRADHETTPPPGPSGATPSPSA